MKLSKCWQHRIPYCDHAACYSCLRAAFVDELCRRALQYGSIPKYFCNNSVNSPAFELARLTRTIEHDTYRLSYPCPICTIRTSDPPISFRTLSEMVIPLIPSQLDTVSISAGQGSFNMFFPHHHHWSFPNHLSLVLSHPQLLCMLEALCVILSRTSCSTM